MDHATPSASRPSLNRLAFSATVHCLTGCSIGEVLGMVIGTALGWSNWATVAIAVVLAFVFGYLLTLIPLLRAGMEFPATLALAFASDTVSITIMEIVDNAVMLIIPGAMDAGLTEPLFWGSLIFSLILAGIAAFPANRWLIAQGRGHALVHKHHGHHPSGAGSSDKEHRAADHTSHH
jgi:hypothetical protein